MHILLLVWIACGQKLIDDPAFLDYENGKPKINKSHSCILASRKDVTEIQVQSGSVMEDVYFVDPHKVQSKVANKNANTDFKCRLSMNLLDTLIKASIICFSG